MEPTLPGTCCHTVEQGWLAGEEGVAMYINIGLSDGSSMNFTASAFMK